MKKIILPALLFMFIIANANAQLEKSNFLLSGSIGYNHLNDVTGNSKSETNYFNLTPSVGYFLTNNFALGIQGNLINSKNSSSQLETKQFGITVGPFARYYVPFTDKFAFFGQGAVAAGFTNRKDIFTDPVSHKSNTVKTDYNNLNAKITPGITFFPSNKVGIEFMFGNLDYSNSKVKDTDSKTNSFNIGVDLKSVLLGISFYL